jgi:UDP-N-acetylmuramyl tripeptide synthase/very-short-patch-repair endonuclease
LPFEDSRRLTGSNLHFADVGAVLETVGIDVDRALLDEWRVRVQRAGAELGWPATTPVARAHATGASLAVQAPLDQLFSATEANEWALLASLFSLREKMPEGQMWEGYSHIPISFEGTKKLPIDEETLAFVRTLRTLSTDAEHLMWSLLRNRRVHGHKFRRRHAVGPYVLDFYCHELKLAIELDGGQHNEPSECARDARRNAFMAERGIVTLRFWNPDVVGRTEEVLGLVWNQARQLSHDGRALQTVPLSPSSALRAPSPGGGREAMFHAPGHPAAWDEDSAMHTLRAFARAERNPALVALVDAARARGLTVLIDDETISLGIGSGSRIWPLAQFPAPEQIDWNALHEAPIALVTGSNGKTTTTRLLAAFARAYGATVAYTSTDGVIADGTMLAAGDYSGPAGARVALREPGIDLVILETARGGILRRGIAVQRADVAIVTNVSDDHFGEYGVHDLDDLVAVKLAVARTLGRDGVLVLNADDRLLARHARALDVRKAWFSLEADPGVLQSCRADGEASCTVRDGHLFLHRDGVASDLGTIARMPLGYHGAARYNIANIAAAALAASVLGVPAATIAAVLIRFGAARTDNPGRLQLWSFGGIDAFVDYAHNPEGLRGLLDVATRMRGGRLGLVLGQAGNREDKEIRELAGVAAAFAPDLVVLKDIGGMLRGRAPGDVAVILRDQLVRDGMRDSRIVEQLDEFAAVRDLLAWAREGDVLVLPIHGSDVKPKVAALLDALQGAAWTAGSPLPRHSESM